VTSRRRFLLDSSLLLAGAPLKRWFDAPARAMHG
jgi:hypothetical protein